MPTYILGGWLWLHNGNDYLKIKCEGIFYTLMFEPEIEHKAGGVNIGWDLALKYVVVKAVGLWIESNADQVDLLTYLTTWQQANTLKVSVQRNSSSDLEKMDGTNTNFPCHISGGIKEVNKMKGDQQKYRVSEIQLIQSGTAS